MVGRSAVLFSATVVLAGILAAARATLGTCAPSAPLGACDARLRCRFGRIGKSQFRQRPFVGLVRSATARCLLSSPDRCGGGQVAPLRDAEICGASGKPCQKPRADDDVVGGCRGGVGDVGWRPRRRDDPGRSGCDLIGRGWPVRWQRHAFGAGFGFVGAWRDGGDRGRAEARFFDRIWTLSRFCVLSLFLPPPNSFASKVGLPVEGLALSSESSTPAFRAEAREVADGVRPLWLQFGKRNL